MNELEKYRQLFIKEATGLIDSLEGILLDLETNPENTARIGEVFRVMHTLKGVGSMYGYTGISDITHGLENIFDKVRNGQCAVTPEIIELTFQSIDHLFALLEDPQVEKEENRIKQLNFQNRISTIVGNAKNIPKKAIPIVKKSTKSTYNIIFQPTDEIIERRISILYSFKDLAEIGEIKAVKSLSADDNKDRWSLFFVGECTRDQVEEALMFIYEYCTFEKVADFDLFDENELNERQSFIKSIELQTHEEPKVEIVTSTPSAETEVPSTNSNGEAKSPAILESIRQNMNRISVESEKIDSLMYLVSELITTNSQLLLLTQSSEYDSIRTQIERIDLLSKQFRNNALEIRLIPIRDVVPKFQRMIRDVSKQLGKEVEFVTEGMETELDKSSIDIIVEPLVHLLRNALDHGVETPEQRREKGKDPKGVITLSAWYSGNNVFVKVQDDGKGIDKSKIFAKAVEKGLIDPKAKLSDKETFDLLCLSGFSTATEITNISGRGVGMDVVKKKIAEVRGDLEIESKIDKGSTFTIKLQQSVAILDTLLVQSLNAKWLIPLVDVEVCTQVGNEDLERGQRMGTLEHYGQLIPFLSLKNYFNKGLQPINTINNHTSKMVVVKKNNVRFAIVTDTIVGQHQAVLKNMGQLLKDHPEISAASLLGDGEVAFLLDTNQFSQQFSRAN